MSSNALVGSSPLSADAMMYKPNRASQLNGFLVADLLLTLDRLQSRVYAIPDSFSWRVPLFLGPHPWGDCLCGDELTDHPLDGMTVQMSE